jgi:hypothetical protein
MVEAGARDILPAGARKVRVHRDRRSVPKIASMHRGLLQELRYARTVATTMPTNGLGAPRLGIFISVVGKPQVPRYNGTSAASDYQGDNGNSLVKAVFFYADVIDAVR